MDTMSLFGAYRKHSQYSHCHLYIYTGELPALSLLLILQLGYLHVGVLKSNALHMMGKVVPDGSICLRVSK